MIAESMHVMSVGRSTVVFFPIDCVSSGRRDLAVEYVNSMLELIGNTPLLKLNRVAKDVPANVFVKLEHLNPSGSYKDRMAIAMVEAAEKGLTWNKRKLEPGGVVCDASAGNTAPALAFVCAVKGYKAKLCAYRPVLRGASTRLKITDAFGPDVSECRPPSDFLSKKELAKIPKDEQDLAWVIAGKVHMSKLEAENRNVVWVDQIYNKYNYIGQMSMGYEMYDQLDGKIDAWGCATGSGATLLGVALALEERGIKPSTFGVVPVGSESYVRLKKPEARKGEFEIPGVNRRLVDWMGLKKWQTEKSIIEEMIEKGYPDVFFQVSAEDARNMANRLCREEGIYCGMSSGANVFIALKLAERMEKGQNVVTVIVDRRDRYLGEYPEDVFVV
jgi:cystathionine beta-synthase